MTRYLTNLMRMSLTLLGRFPQHVHVTVKSISTIYAGESSPNAFASSHAYMAYI